MSKPVTVTLKEPISVDGVTISAVTLHTAKARTLRALEAREKEHPGEGAISQMMWLIPQLSGLSEAAVEDLGADDFRALCEGVPVAMGEDQPAEPAKT